MPRSSLPEQTRAKAMRSRWFGSMLAWILKTKAVIFSSVACTVRISATWSRGGGAMSPSALIRSRTPKFRSAEPKKTGVRWPSRKAFLSKGLQASMASDVSSMKASRSFFRQAMGNHFRAVDLGGDFLRVVSRARYCRPGDRSRRRSWNGRSARSPARNRAPASLPLHREFRRDHGFSRSILLMKVMIGMSRMRQTSNSFSVRGSMPLAAAMTMTAASTAVSVR